MLLIVLRSVIRLGRFAPMETTYKTYLKAALSERRRKNPLYSLRAFARQVSMSPSHLSRVMNGKAELSQDSALKVASVLNLKSRETEHFLEMVNLSGQKNKETSEFLKKKIESKTKRYERKKLSMDHYHLVADWYCLPIYELLLTSNFEHNARWIAKRMGITQHEAQSALDRLVALGYIEISPEGKISRKSPESVETTDDLKSLAIQKHHEQMSLKAVAALKEQAVDEREFQSLHFPFDAKDMEKAKEAIRDFVNKFEATFRKEGAKDLFQLNAQFFSITKNIGETK